MANKRIKDLSTTAAVTASDDFIAVDGATNGTRKLDAFNPTFGGNVTVKGALLSHQTATLNLAYEGSSLSQLVAYGADASTYGRANIVLRKAGTGVGAVTALSLTDTTATIAGNLTVSGSTLSVGNGITAAAINIGGGGNTGTQLNITSADGNNDYAVRVLQNSTTSSNGLYIRTKGTRSGDNALYVASNDGSDAILIAKNDKSVSVGGNLTVSGTGGVQLNSVANLTWGGPYGANIPTIASPTGTSLAFYPAGSTSGESARFTSTGSLLLGTTTDSGNGKLQLATHSTSAGGIGFGTDTSLYRAQLGQLALNSSSGGYSSLGLYSAGASQGQLATSGNQIYLDAVQSLYLRTNGATTALTLDTSQNATLAGNYFYVGGGTSFYLRATGSGNGIWYGNNVSVDANYFNVRNQAGSTIYLSVDSTGSAFAGTIATQGGTASTPASASATGTAGTIRWDASYIYVCTAANTWKRVAIATW